MATILIVDDLMMDRLLATEILHEDASLETRQASDGQEALASMERALPDLVLTDLVMPHMDGFELVAAVRKRYPLVPVILMTSQGSEEIAVRALREGAASYVPKRNLVRQLRDTIRGVLAVSRRHRGLTRLLGLLERRQNSFVLRNDAALFEPLITYLQEGISQLGLCDDADRTRVGVALGEALTNALYHGNMEVGSRLRGDDEDAYWALIRDRSCQRPYCDRRIRVDVTLSRDEGRFVLQDEGPGFDPTSLPDPTDPTNLEKLSGRGILLMQSFMDDVVFTPTGNVVTMVKRRRVNAECGMRNAEGEDSRGAG